MGNKTLYIILCICCLLITIPGVFGVSSEFFNWTNDTTTLTGINNTLSRVKMDICDIGGDGTYEMIYGHRHGVMKGYRWNGSSWVENSSLVNGLPDFGNSEEPIPECFDWDSDGSDDTLFVGKDDVGYLASYQWNGTGWETNSTRNQSINFASGMISVCVEDFDNDTYLNAIMGSKGGNITHYEWNGTDWVEDVAAIGEIYTENNASLVTFAMPMFIDVNLDGTKWYVIIPKQGLGSWWGYEYRQGNWERNDDIITNLHYAGSRQRLTTADFDNDSKLEGLYGEYNAGNLFGYELTNKGGVSIQAKSYFTNVSINNFTATIIPNWNASLNETKTTTNGTLWFNITGGISYNISITDPANAYDANFANVTIYQAGTYEATLHPHPIIQVYAKNVFTNATIENFTTTITGNGFNQTYNSSNNYTTHRLPNGTYLLFVDAENYAYGYKNITINTSAEYVNETIYLYTYNSISFVFRDEETLGLINNVSIELISSSYSNNYSTTNGTLYIDNLTADTYTIRYDSDGYYERTYYFVLTNQSHTNITLYLVANTTTEVDAYVYDEINNKVEDAYIKVLRYDLASNSYILREIAKTNFNGQTKLHLKLNDEYYKFIIEYPLGTVKETTSPTYIYSTTLNFQIELNEAVAEDFYNYKNLNYDLSFNNATNNFRFNYVDSENTLSRACLYVYVQDVLNGDTLYNYTCVSSSSATILINVANTSGTTYIGKAYADFGDSELYFLDSVIYSFEVLSVGGKQALFWLIIVTIVIIFIFSWSKTIALIVTPIPMIAFSIFNLVDIAIWLGLALEVVCIIVAIILSDKKR